MCVVSMVMDHYFERWDLPVPGPGPALDFSFLSPVNREEFEILKREVEDLKGLLKAAKKYDRENNQPDCEVEEKVVLLRKIAEAVGIDLDDVLKNKE